MPDLQSVLLGLGAMVLIGVAGCIALTILVCCLGLLLATWRMLVAQWRNKP